LLSSWANMGGRKNRGLAKRSWGLLFVLALVGVNACAPHRVTIKKAPAPPRRARERAGVYHVVERHQTLYRICKTYQADLQEVASLNGISDPGKIRTGQRIFIPGATRVLKVEIYLEDVVEEPEERGKEKTVETEIDFVWPVQGRFTELFDENEAHRHQGIDIASVKGTPIRASGAGKVIYSGNTIKGYGNLIILRHSPEWTTVYAHNDVNLVEEGIWVEKGQIIARMGQTGRASGPHLHFEMRRDNQAVDPLIYLK
jgi:lipoprotein YgeR